MLLAPQTGARECRAALKSAAASLVVVAGSRAGSARVVCFADHCRAWRAGPAPECVARSRSEEPRWVADDVHTLQALLSRERHGLSMLALCAWLPRLVAGVGPSAHSMCVRRLLETGPGNQLLYSAVLRGAPAALALRGDVAQREHNASVFAVYSHHGLPCSAHRDPRVLASLLHYMPTCVDRDTAADNDEDSATGAIWLGLRTVKYESLIARQHRCADGECEWWSAMCDHLVLLRQCGVPGQPFVAHSGKGLALVALFTRNGRVVEYMKLIAHGVIPVNRVDGGGGVIHIAPIGHPATASASYNAQQIALAVQSNGPDAVIAPWRPLAGRYGSADGVGEWASRTLSLITRQLTVSAYADACWRLAQTPPRALDSARLLAWTPATHQALYRFCGELHGLVRVLFLVHETRHTVLASLPYELLFHVFHCLMLAHCARRQ